VQARLTVFFIPGKALPLMARLDDYEYDGNSIVVTENKHYAAGVPAVLANLGRK